MYSSYNLYLTWKCNFKCAHCVHSCDMNQDHMSLKNLNRAFEFLDWMLNCPSISVGVIGITGGEATLHPNFWDVVIPKLRMIRNRYEKIDVELHTNASIPVPKLERTYDNQRVFTKVIVGYDMFHAKFKPLNKLCLDDYAFITKEIVLRKNLYCVHKNIPFGDTINCSILRYKGRAAELKYEYLDTTMVDCCRKQNMFTYNIAFTPSYITFCGEHARAETSPDGKIALDYDDNLSNDEILQKSFTYTQQYTVNKCLRPCRRAYISEKNFSNASVSQME